jgi:sensor c-di-GMP phosphodiesterase-like protein
MFLKQHLVDLRDMVHRVKREKAALASELDTYKATNQELQQKNASSENLLKQKDMQIQLLYADNCNTVNQFRVKQKKLERDAFVLKCLLLVALFALFVKLLA